MLAPLFADLLSSTAALFGIALGVIGVAGVGVGLGRRWVKRKEGPAAERTLLHTLNTALVGEGDPTPFNQHPEPGLIKDVATLKQNYVDLNDRFDELLHGLVPNGGDTDHVGDVLQRQGNRLTKIMDHLGIEDL